MESGIFGKVFEDELRHIIFKIMNEYYSNRNFKDVHLNDEDDNEMMTSVEIAEYTQLSLSYINKLLNIPLKEGGIPSVKIGNRRRVWKHELDEWLNKQREEFDN